MANVPIAAAAFDRDMRYLAHSRTWLAAHGDNSNRNVVGLSHYEVVPVRQEWREIHQRCLAGGTEQRALDHFDHPDGRRDYLRWLVMPWHSAPGEIGGILIYTESLTEQVETRRRLDEKEGIVRDFFAKSPVGLNLCRMDGRWVESNPAFLGIIGYTAEEADGGLTYWQLTPRKYDAEEAIQLESLRRTRRYGPYEKEFIRKDGTLVPVRLNGFLVEREGEEYIWSLIEDLTVQRALERKLEDERLKAIQTSKLATLGEMAASFAHEINNPLGMIELYAYSLKSAIGDRARTDEAINAIRAAVERASRIVNGLRRFSRETASEAPVPVMLRNAIDDALGLCKPRIQSSGVSFDVEASAPAEVSGNAIELSQVFINLINNALDAVTQIPDPASAKWIRLHVDAAPDDAFIAVTVEDSGGPIPPAVADQLFRAFFTTKKVGDGTGLGLSISRSIIERHGGTLTLDAAAPHTRFVVRLPKASG